MNIPKMSNYLHPYEAYRIPRDKIALNTKNADFLQKDGESSLVLTEKGQKQLVKDRLQYNTLLQIQQNQKATEQQTAAIKKYSENQAKALTVFRRLSNGDIVPSTDEQKLIEYDPKLYLAAKLAQMMAQKAEREKYDSLYGDEEEPLPEGADPSEMNKEMGEFIDAQAGSVVEVSSDGVDFSSIKAFVELGGGLTGAIFDTQA